MKKINLGSVWDKVDALNASAGIPKQIPIGTGFTLAEYSKRYHLNRNTADVVVRGLVNSKKINIIGKRGHAIVYDVV